jgi:hypothetical protein
LTNAIIEWIVAAIASEMKLILVRILGRRLAQDGRRWSQVGMTSRWPFRAQLGMF